MRAHVLMCFVAYVIWKTLAQLCQRAGLREEPRRVIAELEELRLVDVELPTDAGIEIRSRCVTRPTEHQRILIEKLGFKFRIIYENNLRANVVETKTTKPNKSKAAQPLVGEVGLARIDELLQRQ